MRWLRFGFYAVSLAAAGCVSQPTDDKPLTAGWTTSPSPSAPSASMPADATPSAPFAASGGGWTEPQHPSAVSPPESNAFLASWQKAMGAVKNGLAIKPQVMPPNDPVSLNSPTPAVGANIHWRAAQFYESQGNVNEAVVNYERALQVDPKDYTSLLGFARLSDREGDYRRAESLYQRAIAAQPSSPSAYNDLGLCYARRGELNAAKGALEQAVIANASDPLYRNNLASVLVDLRNFDEALQHLTTAHGPAIAQYNLGFMLAERGMTDAAQQHFEAALRVDPHMQPAQLMLARLSGSSNWR